MHLPSVVQGIQSDKDILADAWRVAVGLAKQRLKITTWTKLHHDIGIATYDSISQ